MISINEIFCSSGYVQSCTEGCKSATIGGYVFQAFFPNSLSPKLQTYLKCAEHKLEIYLRRLNIRKCMSVFVNTNFIGSVDEDRSSYTPTPLNIYYIVDLSCHFIDDCIECINLHQLSEFYHLHSFHYTFVY